MNENVLIWKGNMPQIIVIPTADGGYTAEVLEMPGCTSYGETFELALENIHAEIKRRTDEMAAVEADTQEVKIPGQTASV